MHQYDTRAQAMAATIPAGEQLVGLLGYNAPGDGGAALYKKVVSLAAGVIGFQSADGAWWQINEQIVSLYMSGAVGDGSTDCTANIQAAINSVPPGGTLFIPPSVIYNATGQYIGGFLFSSTLTVNSPMNIIGEGMYSNLKTDASFPAGSDNLVINQSGTYWWGLKFAGFSIGNDIVAVPYTRYGGRGLWFSATGGMSRTRIDNLHIGESGNHYSLDIDGAGTQQCIVTRCLIAGGLLFNSTADSQIIENNVFAGRSTLGVLINMPGAGGLQFKQYGDRGGRYNLAGYVAARRSR